MSTENEPIDLSIPFHDEPIRLAEQDSEPAPYVGTDEIVAYAEEHDVKWWDACRHFVDEGRDIGGHNSLPPLRYWEMIARKGKPPVTAAHLAEQAEITRLAEKAETIAPRSTY